MTAQEVELFRQLVEKINRLERRVGLADTLELASGGGVYTNEEAQDAVGTILTDTATIDFTYTDATPSITADVKNDSITFAKLQNIATNSLVGRDTASTGDAENILLNATLEMDGSGNLQRAALTGDVTASAGSNATTVANDAVTNAKAANMAADTIKGRANGAGTGDPTDLTATQVRTIINVASGADVTGTAITALATKTTPVDADAVVITDSAASDAPKRTTGTNFKAYLKTYFDTLYVALTGNQTVAGVKDFTNGIKLNAGTALTVYETGSWTPDLRFGGAATGITYTTRVGTYTRIGNRVWLHCQILLSSKGSATGNADIYGLPFMVGKTAVNPIRWFTMATAYINMFIVPASGGTIAVIRALTAASTDAGAAIANTAFNNTSQLNFEATYEI